MSTSNYRVGRKHSDETRAKISASLKGRVPGMLGKKMSAESRAKLSKSLIGRVPGMLGKSPTAEHRAKISAALNKHNFIDAKDRKLYYTYGIRISDFEHMLEQQGGRCAICKTSDPGTKGWQVDHCHKSGKVRGILCLDCNTSLGRMKDNVVVLRAAADYLERD